MLVAVADFRIFIVGLMVHWITRKPFGSMRPEPKLKSEPPHEVVADESKA